jgi:preprotein translocase subunit SecF
VSYDFVNKRKVWYAISAALLAVSIVSLLTLRLTLGIEFKGGAEFRVTSPTATESAMLNTVSSIVGGEVVVQKVGNDQVRAQTQKLTSTQLAQVQDALAKRFHVSSNSIDTQFIGPSWGKDVSSKALRALLFFLLGVVIFLSLYFEWKMAVAAMVALIHDLIITAGIYSLVGFEVTPATVIGFLTILGYSLYDTVVVFDKVRENTAGLQGGSRMTYSQAANLAVNQTLVRSINTSIIALLPIAAILYAGIVLLGAGPLKDLSLALFVGVAIGAYSSIFIATPILAQLKEREPVMQALAKRVAARAGGGGKPATRGTTVTSRRAAAAEASADEEFEPGEEQPEPAAAVARSATRPPPARRPGQPQRNQPRKGKNRPGGKKRR